MFGLACFHISINPGFTISFLKGMLVISYLAKLAHPRQIQEQQFKTWEWSEPTESHIKGKLTATKSHSSLVVCHAKKGAGVTHALSKSFANTKATVTAATLLCLKAPGTKPGLRNTTLPLSSLLRTAKVGEHL